MTNSYYNPSQTANPGTTVRSAQFNDNNRELAAGFDLLPSPITLFSGNQNFAVDTGTDENIYIVSVRPEVVNAYSDGLVVQIRATKTNTGSSQVNVNGLGLRQIRNKNGDQVIANDIVNGATIVLRYNATTTFFTLDLAESTVTAAVAQAMQSATQSAASATASGQSAENAASSAENALASANAAATSGVSGNYVGAYNTNPVLRNFNDYTNDGTSNYKVRNQSSFPYTVNSATFPNPATDPLLVAFSDLNTINGDRRYSAVFRNDSSGLATENMIAGRIDGVQSVIHAVGNIYKIGATEYRCDTSVTPAPNGINDFTNLTNIEPKNVEQDQSIGSLSLRLAQLETVNPKAVIFISYGQSNARGRAPKVSTLYPDLYTFNGGSQKGDDSASQININFAVREEDMRTSVAYSEFTRNEETTPPGFSSQVVGSGVNRVYAWTGAIGAFHWRSLKPSTGPWASFAQAISQLTEIARSAGFTNIDYVVYWDHGESEADNVAPGNTLTDTPITKDQYKQLLGVVNGDIERAIEYATNTVSPTWRMLITPINFSGSLLSPTFTYDEIQQAQHEYCLETSNAFMVGGKSQLSVETDNIHTTGLGRRYLAEQAGVAYNQVVLTNAWSPPYMRRASILSNVVTVECSENVVIDTQTVSDTSPFYVGTRYGVEFFSDSVQVPISSITVTNNILTITLETAPLGATNEIRVAQQVTATSLTSSDFRPRTSIRSESKIFNSKLDNATIFNFMNPHKIEVS